MTDGHQTELEVAFDALSQEAVDLYLGHSVLTITYNPSDRLFPLTFYRNYVAANRPVKIRNVFDHWPACHKWTDDYLQQSLADTTLSVAVTPNGYADAITDGVFMLPAEQDMTFSEFLAALKKSHSNRASNTPVYYIQKQNSNMTSELTALMNDVDADITWATEAFGCAPDAVNFWMGDERAVTSMHKDHYENIYCVVRGEKTFTLIPPTDQCYIPYTDVDVYQYNIEHDDDDLHFSKIRDEQDASVPWIAVDPVKPDLVRFPEFSKAHIYTVRVGEGETLYLPSLWYHHVQQTQGCIAVNYWYDMQYDIKYNYHQFISNLMSSTQKHKT